MDPERKATPRWPNGTVLLEGTFLYDGTLTCDIRIVFRTGRYGLNDDEDDPPGMEEDREIDAYSVQISKTTQRGFSGVPIDERADSSASFTLADAIADAEGTIGIGHTVRWHTAHFPEVKAAVSPDRWASLAARERDVSSPLEAPASATAEPRERGPFADFLREEFTREELYRVAEAVRSGRSRLELHFNLHDLEVDVAAGRVRLHNILSDVPTIDMSLYEFFVIARRIVWEKERLLAAREFPDRFAR